MKTNQWSLFILLCALPSLGMAQQQYPQQQQQGDSSSRGMLCYKNLKEFRAKCKKADIDADTKKECDQTEADDDYKLCVALEYTAKMNGENLASARDQSGTMDQRIVCLKKAGYTLDYKECVATGTTYDSLQVLEKGMFTYQAQDLASTQQQLQAKAEEEAKKGNLQNAALDAQKGDVLKHKQLNEQQLAAYGAAVGALFTALQTWPGKDVETIRNRCSNRKTTDTDSPGKCMEHMKTALGGAEGEVIGNTVAKKMFEAALQEYLMKAAKAGIEIHRLGKIAESIQHVKDNTVTNGDPSLFDRCVVAPGDPLCIASNGNRTNGTTFTPGDFSVGSSGDTNAFDFNSSNGGVTEFKPDGGDASGAESMVAPNNGFAESAKQAKDILNPAGAANVTPGSAPSAGGGGGVGGGGGGGSASLGDDLQGADQDADKENDIKTTKVSGKYESGGSGFTGIKGAKEASANPFGSIFDQKAQHGPATTIDDASIAQDRGPASTLWINVSKGYQKAIESNRIENLE